MAITNKPFSMTAIATTMASLFIATPAVVKAEMSFTEALTGGKVGFSARARYESVEQDGLKDADAFTLRTTLSYKTLPFHGFSAFVEAEDVSEIGSDDFNNAAGNGKTAYAVIADPEGTEINQAYLQYNFGANEVRFGRQEIFYRGTPFHRFVGNVLWRQNHQSYDALRFTSKVLPDTKFEYSYISKIHTIFGDDREADLGPIDVKDGDIDVNAHLASIQYSGLPIGMVSAYAHLVDYEDGDAASNKIIGARLAGAQPLTEDFKVIYTAEFANQKDYKDGVDQDHDYYLAELGGKYKGWLAKVSHEVQEGDGMTAFRTRLGTNHAYQGWADKFLLTPAQGLEDTYVTVIGKVLGAKLVVVYHDFETDQGSLDAGDELDILLAKKFGKHYSVGVKYADYDADSEFGGADTEKFWVFGQVKF